MESLLGNDWYYTLSTIAQVFAAILGFYSIFVIFKVEKINVFIEELRSILIRLIASAETHKNINSAPKKSEVDEQTLIDLNNESLLKRAKSALRIAKEMKMRVSYSSDRMSYRRMENIPLTFENELRRKKEVINSFKINLILLLFIVFFTIISLGSSNFVNTNYLRNFILFLSIFLSIIVSISFSISIFKIVKE